MLRVKLSSATVSDFKNLDHLVLYILFCFCFSLCMFNLSEYIYTCVGRYRSVTFGVCSVARLFTLSQLVSSVWSPAAQTADGDPYSASPRFSINCYFRLAGFDPEGSVFIGENCLRCLSFSKTDPPCLPKRL